VPPVKKEKKKGEKQPPQQMCFFCCTNPPSTIVKKGKKQEFPACKTCYSIMQPHANGSDNDNEGSAWGWYIADLRPAHPDSIALRDTTMQRCKHCSFRTISDESMRTHMLYSHRPNHPNPFSLNKLDPLERDKWIKALGRQLH
jgi:hypothetical protein